MIYFFDEFSFDTGRREISRKSVPCPAEPQVFDLLQYLIENRTRVVSRDEVFDAVWRGRIVSDSVLSTRINAARQLLGDDGNRQRLIRTLRRKGFRFVGIVREHRLDAEPTAVSGPASAHRVATRVYGAPALVVLPFVAIGDEAKCGAFADGLTDDVVNVLHHLDWLVVMSRHSPQSYAGTPDRLRQAAEKHRARYELTGTVRVSSATIRVIVRLVCLTSGQHLWVQRFDSDASDFFRTQDNIATQAVSALSSQIFAAEAVRATIKSAARVGTWERLVGALFLMNTRKKTGVAAAQRLLKHAAAADPTSSPAFALLSFTTTLGVHLGWHSRNEARPFAFAMAQKALQLNDEDGWAHVAEGYAELQIGNRPHQAIEILQQALRLNPNLAIAHYFSALASAYAGQPDAAFKHADLAERLRPYDLLSRGNDGANDTVRATASFVAGKFGEGVAFARKALTQSPRQTPAFRQLVTNGAMSGDFAEAATALKAIRRLAPGIERWVEESETTWIRRDDYRKYLEAFRMAGL